MKIAVNGESMDTGEAKTIAELINRFQLQPQSILVEHNGLILTVLGTVRHRREWVARSLTEGDRIEFIRVVAGG